MTQRVRITDVSPRDGLQNEPGVIATADKVRLVELLARTGVDEIEVTSFVSPRWVPQLGDAGAVLEGLWNPSPEGRGRGGAESPNPSPEGRGRGGAHAPVIPYTRPPQDQRASEHSRELRAEQTGPEAALWSQLRRDDLIGAHFRRQHPFGPYILDFFTHELALTIEVDGLSHAGADARRNDAERTAFIERHGVTVLRITNDQVVSNLDGVVRQLQRVVRERRDAAARQTPPLPLPSGEGFTRHTPWPLLSALVPNDKGMDSAAALLATGVPLGKLSVFTAASETFCQKNIGATIAQSLDRFVPVIARCKALQLPVRGYVSCAIACPFEGPVAPSTVADVCARLVALGVDELDLGDTIGAGDPHTTRAMLSAVIDRVGPAWLTPQRLTLHLHDTFGHAASCVRAALAMGVRSFDSSVAGLGGCPYASTPGKPAPGNISTELLVSTLRAEGYACGLAHDVNDDALREAAHFASQIVARARSEASRLTLESPPRAAPPSQGPGVPRE